MTTGAGVAANKKKIVSKGASETSLKRQVAEVAFVRQWREDADILRGASIARKSWLVIFSGQKSPKFKDSLKEAERARIA